MLLMLLVACSLHAPHTGLVQTGSGDLLMVGEHGERFRIVAREDASPLQHLEGCTVEVSGPRLGRRIWVDDWKVLDAGDGSMPFVGVLRRDGMQWSLRDRNSGSTVRLDPASLAGLEVHEGSPVLVIGYVLGAHRVNVVRWKALVDESPTRSDGGLR
ncbi:MAG: hypothetical protein VX265_10805 [Myxococcota bacterium]|nr:hypothetical protein [Myxococcota bacterium]MEC8423700.1 hypothetical protein [Myxococcota bacterium]